MPPPVKFPTTIADYRQDVMEAFGACDPAKVFVDQYLIDHPNASLQDLFAEWANPEVPNSWVVWNAWIFATEFGTKISGSIAQFICETMGERVLADHSLGQMWDFYNHLSPYMPQGYLDRFRAALGIS